MVRMLCRSRPPQPCTFLFLTISNNNMTDAQTCEVGVTLVPLDLYHMGTGDLNYHTVGLSAGLKGLMV
jgi:hypothetical protein